MASSARDWFRRFRNRKDNNGDEEGEDDSNKFGVATTIDNAQNEAIASSIVNITPSQLIYLLESKNIEALNKLGGVDGISNLLSVDIKQGLADDSRIHCQNQFGKNTLPKKIPPSLLKMMWDAFCEKILILLTSAAFMSLGIGIYQDIHQGTLSHWIEGAAILFAVFIVVMVNALNDYHREKQFIKLASSAEDRQVNIVRNSKPDLISIFEVAVGDVILLEPGEVVPADGIFISGYNLQCDESGATGEADAIKKGDPRHEMDPFLLSGTRVLDGTGSMLVIAVGENSFQGRMMMALHEETEDTPLQIKLDRLAETIAKCGASMAVLMFFVLIVKYAIQSSIEEGGFPSTTEIIERLLLILIETITVVVVAVPEGLPMAVTLALAYATTRMLQDSNLVRVLSACETMGNASTICSDKTGTLTENKMTVVKGVITDAEFNNNHDEIIISQNSKDLLEEAISVNTTAFESFDVSSQKMNFTGNKTETALLEFITKKMKLDYIGCRSNSTIVDAFPFASERKSMTTVVKSKSDINVVRVHCKGASEIVLGHCTHWMRGDGSIERISTEDLRNLRRLINEMAEECLRTIAVAYREMTVTQYEKKVDEGPPLEELTLLALVGIEDPLREGVSDAVANCQKAGIFVRMVTGDNVITAQSIAKKCGILMRGGVVMEGPRFRQLNEQALEDVIPRLQVLARSSPLDKQILVKKLKEMGEVVAVTGDGTNDGPALKSAHVGFAMGIAGTEVAKEASSIILLDDNFSSIVRAVAWGRCVNDSVRKFLQFQLTVNVSAVIVAFVSATVNPESRSVISAIQLLWVNLIMDTFAALGLATEHPSVEILERHPEPISSNLITVKMAKMIISQAILQLGIIFTMLYAGRSLFHLGDGEYSEKVLSTMIFNTFVFLQLLNEINCRILDNRLNPFHGILRNPVFIIIWIGTVLVQILLITFGGVAFKTVPLSVELWLICVAIGLLSLPMAFITRLLPDWKSKDDEEGKRIMVSKERLHWQAAITDVRRSLAVFSAIRRARQTQ